MYYRKIYFILVFFGEIGMMFWRDFVWVPDIVAQSGQEGLDKGGVRLCL